MSKSKRNTVDPDDIMGTFGADTARWFMLSDSPPERDVIWTEEGVQGAGRFAQRLWRLVNDIAEITAAEARPGKDRQAALEIRRDAHKTLDKVNRAIEDLRFNTAVAFMYSQANLLEMAVRDAAGRGGATAAEQAALREAGDMLVKLFARLCRTLPGDAGRGWGTRRWLPREPGPRSTKPCCSATP